MVTEFESMWLPDVVYTLLFRRIFTSLNAYSLIYENIARYSEQKKLDERLKNKKLKLDLLCFKT